MKVLFTASTYSHIVHFHLPYLHWFQEQGWTVHTACGGDPIPIPYADEVLSMPFKKRMTSLENFRAARLLRDKISREGYNLIATHTSLAAFFTRLAVPKRNRRERVVNMAHGYLFDDDTQSLKRTLLLAAERLCAPQTDLVLTMNSYDYELARRYHLGREVQNIPGVGVNFRALDDVEPGARAVLRERYGIPEAAFLLVYPAEFSSRKSQMVLLRALERLPETVMLALPGDGALLEECRKFALERGLETRVIFPGYEKYMASWYAAADAAVTASRSEGLPFNVIEAMYAGLPVVASEVKGHMDLIRDKETGMLYPYGDSDACAARIWELLESPELRQALGRNAHIAAEKYGLDAVFPQVIAAYASVMTGKIKNMGYIEQKNTYG